jgi:outer membrane autotransporter protein
VVLAPRNATIFPELATVAIIDAERSIDTLLSHAIAAPTSTGSAQLAFNDVSNPLGATHGGGEEIAELGNIVPEVYAAYGAWIEASGNFADIRAGNGAPGYHAQTGGFLAGLARNITPEASLGLAVGYEHFNLSEDDTHASATDDTGRIALYGAYDFGPVTLSAAGGLGYDAFSTTRPLPVGTAKENHSGLEANLGLQLSQTLNLGALQLMPAAGFDYANLQEDSFAESGASGADLNGHAHGTSSLQPFIGVAAGQSFGLGNWSVTPSVHVTWRYEALNTQRSLIVATQDGTLFNINGVSAARDQLDTGASLSASAGPNLQIYGAYDAQIGFGFGLDQSISAGVKYNF